ncbi:MAG: hypothetical protein ED557_00925 [Balneola sp.]|nr:MAG: hypothetical protein ED557_00925 [Balneola sp.]
MTIQRKIIVPIVLVGMLMFQACSKSMVVQDVNYAQKIESVLIPNDEGLVQDIRHGISYSILPFQLEEFQDTTQILVSEIRMIRNHQGYYFITADGFKNVYVMEPRRNELKLKRKIEVSEFGLQSPAFNWRAPSVQLLSTNNEAVLLTEKGIYKKEDAS